jgi:hypothetical protein
MSVLTLGSVRDALIVATVSEWLNNDNAYMVRVLAAIASLDDDHNVYSADALAADDTTDPAEIVAIAYSYHFE